ncbi:MAG TPA: methyl-accepting chemotaxis protein [Rhodopila sp.]|uniref:HAMP domain-containing methyl-accepting chemotaxis protein n=1 Tax=Rhodopila sp. TaxID=2480087 RepID=UPI002BB3C1AF|nr:methyl-accepting chemotaxis protein [Rhodopila sp.]HVY13845.1 methyl-accepting chemotaxis protein [Rhodopila sp.]
MASEISHWTLRRSIFASFAAVLVMMLVMSAVVFFSLRRIQMETQEVAADSLPSVNGSFEIMNAWLADYSLVQQALAEMGGTGADRFISQIQANQTKLDALIGKYESLVNSKQESSFFNAIKAARAPYVQAENGILAQLATGHAPESVTSLRHPLETALDNGRTAIHRLIDYDRDDASVAISQIFSALYASEISILASIALGLAVALLCGHLLMRSIRGPLGQLSAALSSSGVQVRSSVTEIAASAKEHQATATEIAATTAEIGATSKEISATSRELVKTMNEVAEVAEQSASLAVNGQTGLTHMEETMRRVTDAAGSISAKLAILNEKTSNISQVVTTITKVADQTNLLSLNAAIEAEKAGEHGKGFGVVAVEIRRLADQTAVATTEIGQTVKEIQSAVSTSVMGMDRFAEEVRRGMQEVQQVSESLTQIIQYVQALAPRADSVNEGMQAQATGAEQITQALNQLSEAAQQTVDSLQQSSIAVDTLNQVVTNLSGGVLRLEKMI